MTGVLLTRCRCELGSAHEWLLFTLICANPGPRLTQRPLQAEAAVSARLQSHAWGSMGTGSPRGRSSLLPQQTPPGDTRGGPSRFRSPGGCAGPRPPLPAGRTLACHSWDHSSTGPPRESRADSLEGFRDPDWLNLRGMMEIKNYRL